MDERERHQVIEAFQIWARFHPAPDRVVLQLGSGKEFTPREIAEAVAKGTEFGILQMAVVEYAAERFGLVDILEGLMSNAATPEPA